MTEEPSAGSPPPPAVAQQSSAPTATTATVNTSTIRTTTTRPITTATSTNTAVTTTRTTRKTIPITPSAQLGNHEQSTQASATARAPLQLQPAQLAPGVSSSQQAQISQQSQPATAVPPTAQRQPAQTVPAAPNKEHNRPPQQPTRKAGQDQFRIVRFGTNYGVPNQQPQPYPQQPAQPPAFQAPHPPINDPLRNQFYEILGELDPFKATPKEFIHLLVHAAVRDGEIARSLFRLNHDRLHYPQFWRPPIPPDLAVQPRPDASIPAPQPPNAHTGTLVPVSSTPAAPTPAAPPASSSAPLAALSETLTGFRTGSLTGVPLHASLNAPASASTSASALQVVEKSARASEPALKRKQDWSDDQKSMPHPTSRTGIGPRMVIYWGPPEPPTVHYGQTWNPGFPPQNQLQTASTALRYPSAPSLSPHGVPIPVETLPIVPVQATSSRSATIHNGVEIIDSEPKEQSCNFTWALNRAETHLGFTGNYNGMSEVRQLSTGYEVALKVQKLLKNLNTTLDNHVTFANRVHILTVMREIVAATLEAETTIGKECRECSQEYDSAYLAAVRKLTPQQLQRLKALEGGKWLQEMQDLVDEADKQAMFPLLRGALDHLSAAA